MLSLLLAAPFIYTYWVEPCSRKETACLETDTLLADWALEAWQRASGGRIEFQKVREREDAQIRIHWASPHDGVYGEARPAIINGKRGSVIRILPDTAQFSKRISEAAAKDPLLRDAIVYLTCLHESGHALGLRHTGAFDDIMYTFGYGGDILEYFERYRRKLKSREDTREHSGVSAQDQARLLRLLDSLPELR